MIPSSFYPPEANELTVLCRRVHNALNKHPKYLTKGKRAQLDWRAFGNSLGPHFFDFVKKSGNAFTLLEDPPRFLPSDGNWPIEKQPKIEDAANLFARGVSQVRNNIEHAGKFLTEEEDQEKRRSLTLAREALWVLKVAIEKHPDSKDLFAKF